MGKFFLRFFLILFIVIISTIIFLSYFGLETSRFNALIKSKANAVNQNVNLEFSTTKIYLNPAELNLAIKLLNPKVLIRNNEINLSKLDLFLSLKSFIGSDFILKRAEVAFIRNDIKDLTKITNIFVPKIINKQLNKIFKKGNLEGEFVIPFTLDGSIAENYGFSGKISNASIKFTNKFYIEDLTAKISHTRGSESEDFTLIVSKGSTYDLDLAESKIELKRGKKLTNIKSSIRTNGKLNFTQIKKISSLFGFGVNNFKDINGTVNLKTNVNFDLNKRFRVKNLLYSTEGNIDHFEIHAEEKEFIKEYLPNYSTKMVFKNTDIKFSNSKSSHTGEFNGFIKKEDKLDSFKIKEIYNYNEKSFDINGKIDLTNSEVKVSKLNYKKDSGKKSELSFNVNFILNKYYNIKNLKFLTDKDKIYLSSIKLNKKLEVMDLKKLEIKTFLDEIKNNDLSITKEKKIIILGEIFDAQPLLKSLYKKSDKKIFSKNFSSEMQINFKKVFTGTNDDISNFAMISSINKGSYSKLNLKGNFSKDEIIEMSIYQVNEDKKTVQVISDRARPFIKNFDFIKGFEGGKLVYESNIVKGLSTSNLIITDFKVSKVPALAKLLTLASLQGIADTLSGEGIRFEILEMQSNSKGNILNIEEAYISGPAVSILFDGYVDKGKVVSLSGTLVPARTINSIIASIPVLGEILVGKKTGEGVFGVSFKMKGPPKDIKTTVNPIKTLTPRFIVRSIERMKKEKEEKVK